MSVVSYGGGGRWRTMAIRVGHSKASEYVPIVAVAAMPMGRDAPWWTSVISFPLLAVVMTLGGASWYHSHHLCEACIAGLPLDAQEQAARKIRWLRAYHHLYNNMGRSVLVLAVGLALFWAGLHVTWLRLSSGIEWNLGMLALFGWLEVASIPSNIHARLQPACPMCRRRWGKDDDETPAPLPDNSPTARV